MPFEIRSDADVHEAIARLEAGAMDEELHFVDWPRFEVTIRGESFDGGVPTRIMPALLRVQQAIDRAYARSVGRDGRRLAREERRRIELIVRVKPGSTTFVSELAPVLNNALTAAVKNMSGPETVITILGVALIVGGVVVWKAHINSRAELRRIDHRTRMSEEETRRLQAIADLASSHPMVRASLDDMEAAQDTLLRGLEFGDQLLAGDESLVDGETGRRIARKPRPEPVQDRLDGTFVILSVDSGRVRSGFRVRVRDTGTGDELTVAIPAGTLPPDQISELQSGEWGKKPLRMRINVARIGRKIIEATLVSAGLSQAEA